MSHGRPRHGKDALISRGAPGSVPFVVVDRGLVSALIGRVEEAPSTEQRMVDPTRQPGVMPFWVFGARALRKIDYICPWVLVVDHTPLGVGRDHLGNGVVGAGGAAPLRSDVIAKAHATFGLVGARSVDGQGATFDGGGNVRANVCDGLAFVVV